MSILKEYNTPEGDLICINFHVLYARVERTEITSRSIPCSRQPSYRGKNPWQRCDDAGELHRSLLQRQRADSSGNRENDGYRDGSWIFYFVEQPFLHTPTRVNSHKVCHYIQKRPPRWRLCRRCPPNCVSLVVFKGLFQGFSALSLFFPLPFSTLLECPFALGVSDASD